MKQIYLSLLLFLCSLFSFGQQDKIDSLKTELKKSSDFNNKARNLEELSRVLLDIDPAESTIYAKTLLEDSKKEKNKIKQSIAYKLLGNIQQTLGDRNEALKSFKEGVNNLEKTEKSILKAELFGSIGNVFSDEKKSDSAFFYWFKAEKIFKILEDERGLTIMNFNIATNYFGKSDYLNTIKYLKETEKHNEKYESSYFEMRTNSLYGSVFAIYGRYNKAEEYILKAKVQAEKTLSFFDIVENTSALAAIKFRQGKQKEALEIREGLAALVNPIDQVKKNNLVLSSHIDHANQLIGLGHINKAREIFEKRIEPNKESLGILTEPAKMLSLISNKNISNKELESQMIKMYLEENLAGKIQGLKLISQLYRSNNVPSKVIQIQDSLLVYQERMNIENTLNYLHDIETKYQTEKKEKQLAEQKIATQEQELLTQKANTRNWLLALGLLLLGISSFFIWKRYKSEAKAKQIISKQKTQIEKLQKEFHHRLKNDFRSVNSFISLVQRQFSDIEIKERLNELKNRVTSMFKVHEILLQEDDITQVKAHPYLFELSKNVEEKYKDQNIKLTCNIDETESIIADKAIPFGIVLNEFVTNSYKYAFDKDGGEITIDFKSDKVNHHLTLTDNGKGLPKDFDINKLRSLGMSIIPMFADLHDGSYKLDGTEGVSLILTLPKKVA